MLTRNPQARGICSCVKVHRKHATRAFPVAVDMQDKYPRNSFDHGCETTRTAVEFVVQTLFGERLPETQQVIDR